MSEAKLIMPLEHLRLESGERLFSASQFDNEENIETRNAIDLLESHRRSVHPCFESVIWFEILLEKWVLGESLEVASGLTRSQAKEIRQRLQTMHLREAESCVDTSIVGTKSRSTVLADEIKRFEARFGSESAMQPEPLPSWSRLRRCVWRARRFGKLPMTWERVAKRIE